MRAKQGSTVLKGCIAVLDHYDPYTGLRRNDEPSRSIAFYGAVPPRGKLALRPGRRRSRSGPETPRTKACFMMRAT